MPLPLEYGYFNPRNRIADNGITIVWFCPGEGRVVLPSASGVTGCISDVSGKRAGDIFAAGKDAGATSLGLDKFSSNNGEFARNARMWPTL